MSSSLAKEAVSTYISHACSVLRDGDHEKALKVLERAHKISLTKLGQPNKHTVCVDVALRAIREEQTRGPPSRLLTMLPADVARNIDAMLLADDAPHRVRRWSLSEPERKKPGSWKVVGSFVNMRHHGDPPDPHAPPDLLADVVRWIEANDDLSECEGHAGGAAAVAGLARADGVPEDDGDARAGCSIKVVIQRTLNRARGWATPSFDLQALLDAFSLFCLDGGAIAAAVECHLAASRLDRAAVLVRGAAAGLLSGATGGVCGVNHFEGCRTGVRRAAWEGFIGALSATATLVGRVLFRADVVMLAVTRLGEMV